MTKQVKDNRPTFYTKDGKPIRAVGILIYVKKNEKKIFLFRFSKKYSSDLGGKTDQKDNCPLDTALREAVEETNAHLFSPKHNSQICYEILKEEFNKQNPEPYYDASCKYLVYQIELDYKYKSMSLIRFGTIETFNNEKHRFFWSSEFPNNLHPRLSNFCKNYKNINEKNNINLEFKNLTI